MTRPLSSLNRAFFYRLASPVLFIPWVWTQFFASAISWALIALYSVWTWNTTLYYVPLLSLVVAFPIIVPFQESQEPIINILELITENIDDFVNDIFLPVIEDIFYIVQPGCWFYNFLWDAGVSIFRIAIFNPVKLAVSMLLPTDPFAFFLTIPFSTMAFPVTTFIDTSSAPNWIVGPYGRRDATHPLLDGSRYIRYDDDEAAAALIRWIRLHRPQDVDPQTGKVRMVIMPALLDQWTSPTTPQVVRRAISEQLLRKQMDRDLGIEEPGWWEPKLDKDDADQGPDETTPQPSRWKRVFGIPDHVTRQGMGVVRLDVIPDLEEEYGKERTRGVHVPPGSMAFRFLADEKGTRDLSITIFQDVAEVFATIFDAVVTVLVQLLKITLRIAKVLFGNLESFFSNSFEFVANVFNQVWAEFLGLPCLKFNSVEVFAISLLDCICGPLTQAVKNLGGNIQQWFNYERPTSISGLPQAILGCIGLGCIDINLLVSNPQQFAFQLFGDCMNFPDLAVCCVVYPTKCLINTLMALTHCSTKCGGTVNVSPPTCGFTNNSGDDALKCIVIWIMEQLFSTFNSGKGTVSACFVNGCPDLGSLSGKFVNCIAFSILNVNAWFDALKPILRKLLGLGGGGFLGDIIGFGAARRYDVHGEEIEHKIYRVRTEDTYDPTVKYSRDAPWMDDGVGGRGRSGVLTFHDWLERRRSTAQNGLEVAREPWIPQADVDDAYDGSGEKGKRMLGLQRGSGGSRRNASAVTSLLVADPNRTVSEYGESGLDMMLRIEEETRQKYLQAFYNDMDPSDSEIDAMLERQEQQSKAYSSLPMIHQFSRALSQESRARHRAALQARIDRRVYSNPYLRAVTSRVSEVLRDMTDFAEFRIYGPDPFVLPPEDADPEDDPRVERVPRFQDTAAEKAHAYAMYLKAVKDNPYYAGLYKMLFQLGDPTLIGKENMDANNTWQALAAHRNDPLFHMGRMMAASRQMVYTYGVIFDQVWWEPDTFSFHLPNYAQIHKLALQTHLPAYMDDMRAAIVSMFQVEAEESDQEDAFHQMVERAAEYADMEADDAYDTTAPPFRAQHDEVAQTYSFIVQLEVSVRTVVTRLLAPDYLDPMLEELGTRSPVHARYCERMRNRVDTLKASSDQAHTDLWQKIDAWRAQQAGTMTVQRTDEDGKPYTEVVNRPLVDLDPVAHPDAGNRTLRVGERVRFADGKTGVYLGTVGSGNPLSPTRAGPGLREGRGWNPESAALGFNTRASQILAVGKAVIKVVMFLVNNWRLIATGLVTVVSSPWARVFWESWFQFLWNRIIRPLYSHGLRGLFPNLASVLALVVDFTVLNETIWFFLVNELIRYILCYAWTALIVLTLWPIFIITNILSLGLTKPIGATIMILVIVLGLLFPYCPPEQILKDNKLTQMPWKYIDDIFECYGPIDLLNIKIGKAVYNGVCSVSSDCPGGAPCICENKGGQYNSIFATFIDDTACGTDAAPTGQCLCWPKIDCQFLFPRIGVNRLFDVDCSDAYGYRINKITWYDTSNWIEIFTNAYLNFWISLRYVTRVLTSAPGLNPLLFMLLLTVAALIFFYANVYAGLAIAILTLGFEYALPLWSRLTIDHIIPGLQNFRSHTVFPLSNLASWILTFLRFSNHSTADPLGSAGTGEPVCWFFNIGTMFGGAAVAFFFWATIAALVWYGLGPIIWFVFNNVSVPVRMAAAPFWYYYQQSRLKRHFAKARSLIRRAMPAWTRRGAATAGAGIWNVASHLMPDAPQTPLNRWINKYYPNPDDAEWVRAAIQHGQFTQPIVMDGRDRAYGGGTLDYETHPNPVDISARPPRWSSSPRQRRGMRTRYPGRPRIVRSRRRPTPRETPPRDTGSDAAAAAAKNRDEHEKQV